MAFGVTSIGNESSVRRKKSCVTIAACVSVTSLAVRRHFSFFVNIAQAAYESSV